MHVGPLTGEKEKKKTDLQFSDVDQDLVVSPAIEGQCSLHLSAAQGFFFYLLFYLPAFHFQFQGHLSFIVQQKFELTKKNHNTVPTVQKRTKSESIKKKKKKISRPAF